ncbi:MAG: transposase [Moorea sp. SIO4G2]|nr:transposase [Moorena sp. SIO4G2]
MRPLFWNPPIALSPSEQQVAKKIRKAKLFLILREIRHQLFDEQFQTELATLFKDSTVGKCPVPPAQLGLAIILQAYMGVSDDEVIEALNMERRWQLVLDCLDCEKAPFGKGTLVRFRAALIASEGDRRLVERTIEMVEKKGGFSSRTLRGALDSSPLWGAAKVEDTYNLLGHALRKALEVIAHQQGKKLDIIASQSGASLIAGSSLKAALDLDWDDPDSRTQALITILQTLNQVESWVEQEASLDEQTLKDVNQHLGVARTVEAQDVEVIDNGDPKLRKGVAKNRRISIEDEHMRHGRKSSSKRFDGYKRHILKDLDSGLVRADR